MPEDGSPGSVRAMLRAATDAQHQRLHVLPAFAALAEGRIALHDYAALLQRKLGFHAALDARLEGVDDLAALGIDLAERRRTPLLRDDLRWLGMSDAVPLAPLPVLRGAAEAMGALYVAEGSTLGGRQLARALDGLLPPGEDGRRFLLGHGARHGAMWRDFCGALERCGADLAARDAMIAGAIATFAAFEAWFSVPEAIAAA
ncbi:biliverdin-producing heme oxygenase [Roseomonas sp. AR75]|uniref:biliverdin-producing heme oxygenase n=1 Tax=Roseomonas sp. AR75 TaxID=2562311 RepID=UPI0010C01057|nr:biliverdin-producing heme oxygenase [Roseomonas sp. AR75]